MKTLLTFFSIFFLASALNAQTISCIESNLNSDWHVLGPVSYSTSDLGRVTAIYVDPANIDIIVAGTRGSGIWRSTDGGDNWVSITGLQIPALGIISIAGKNGLLYATARFQGSDISMYNAGLIVSSDNGITWSVVSSLPTEIYAVVGVFTNYAVVGVFTDHLT